MSGRGGRSLLWLFSFLMFVVFVFVLVLVFVFLQSREKCRGYSDGGVVVIVEIVWW